MNVALWVLQVLLALHTLMGAVWKFTNSEQAVPSLKALPHGVWLALIAVELFAAVALVLPALRRSLSALVPLAALCVVAEMLLFSGVHLSSGAAEHGELIYWGVVAALSGFVAWGRWALKPLSPAVG